MGIGSQWNTKGSGQTEISEFKVAITVNEQVLWLQIAVKNTMAVAVTDTLAQLAHELLDHLITKTKTAEVWTRAFWESLAAATITDWQCLHVFLEIKVEELEDEVELVAVGVDNVEETDNVWVVHLLEEGNLADGGGWDTLIFGLETDLLESDNASVVEEIAGLVDDTVGSCTASVLASRNQGDKCYYEKHNITTSHTLANLLKFLIVLHIEERC